PASGGPLELVEVRFGVAALVRAPVDAGRAADFALDDALGYGLRLLSGDFAILLVEVLVLVFKIFGRLAEVVQIVAVARPGIEDFLEFALGDVAVVEGGFEYACEVLRPVSNLTQGVDQLFDGHGRVNEVRRQEARLGHAGREDADDQAQRELASLPLAELL
ncbi:hypothetical protein M885DRAFT_604530, partial [Pelagophyceae sp. CCMP2097]